MREPETHRQTQRDVVNLAVLVGEPFVTHPYDGRSEIYGRTVDACVRSGFAPRGIEVSETATLVVSVAAGGPDLKR